VRFEPGTKKARIRRRRLLKQCRFWPSVYKRNGSAISKLPCSATGYPCLVVTIELDRKHIIELKILILAFAGLLFRFNLFPRSHSRYRKDEGCRIRFVNNLKILEVILSRIMTKDPAICVPRLDTTQWFFIERFLNFMNSHFNQKLIWNHRPIMQTHSKSKPHSKGCQVSTISGWCFQKASGLPRSNAGWLRFVEFANRSGCVKSGHSDHVPLFFLGHISCICRHHKSFRGDWSLLRDGNAF